MRAALHILRPLAWRNLWRNPKRTAITMVVVTIGLWSILTFGALLSAWAESSRVATLGLLTGQGQIHAPGYRDDPNIENLMPPPGPSLTAALQNPAISAWTPRLLVPAVVVSEYKTLPITMLAVNPAGERALSTLPGKLVAGRYLTGPKDDGVVLGLNLARRLKTELGRRVILMSQAKDGSLAERSFDIVGLFDADLQTEDTYAITGLRAAQTFLGLRDQIAEIVFTVPKDEDLAGVITALTAASPDAEVLPWRKLSLFFAALDGFMSSFVYIWLGIMFVLMAIGIVNTQLMAVFERTQEFGLLRALGLKAHMILLLVTLESALLIGMGVVLGMALAALTLLGFRGGIDLSAFAEALEMFQAGLVLYPKFDPGAFVFNALVIWILGVIVALWPAYRAAKSSPMEAMRHVT